jgi:excisionase family DNA binding protein
MRARHISSPENGPQNTAISSQKSEGSHRPREINPQERFAVSDFQEKTTQPDLDGHACPVSRNSRGRCRAWECLTGTGDQKQNELNEALRCFARHHNWHDPGHITNKLKLRLAFAKPIRITVNEFLADRRDGLAEQIRGDFARLQEAIHTIDRMCGKRCDEEDELGRLEHTKAQLERSILELADLIEIGLKNEDRRIKNAETTQQAPENGDQWLTNREAAKILGVRRGTVSKWAKKGRFSDNGIKGQKKRLSKASVLLVKQEIDDEYIKNDEEDVRNDLRRYK